MRPDPEVLTEKGPPPTPPGDSAAAGPPAAAAGAAGVDSTRARLGACGIDDLDALAARCQQSRQALGQPAARWAAPRLLEALYDAVVIKGLPARRAAAALTLVAADPVSKSPMRLGCPGPWWDRSPEPSRPGLTPDEANELDGLEVRLREADGRRVWLQQRARAALLDRGQPVTRLNVARLACHLLDEAELAPC